MKKTLCFIAIAASCILSVQSCSVFDDRTGCPSYLTVWYDLFPGDVASAGRTLHLAARDEEGLVFDSVLDADDYPAGTEVKVKKGFATVSALTGMETMTRKDGVLTIPEGGECDSLYLHVGRPDCCDDLAEDHVVTHKQFCTLTVVVEGAEVWEGDGLWQAFSQWNGLDAFTASSVSGSLVTPLRYVGGASWQCRLVRQGDDAVYLEFDGPTGETVRVDLGRVMAEAGYDWNAVDLEDFTLYIRKAEGGWQWSIAPWRDGGDQQIRV